MILSSEMLSSLSEHTDTYKLKLHVAVLDEERGADCRVRSGVPNVLPSQESAVHVVVMCRGE